MNKTGMSAPLLERIWAWIHETFPERQIYIRSDGRVQFFTFSPSLQATMAGLALIFLGWIAFATVNVVFKDRIIAAQDHRFQKMQSAYENRLTDLQISYDELNGALVGAEDKFKATADALTTKQNAIAGFLNGRAAYRPPAGSGDDSITQALHAPMAQDRGTASDSIEFNGVTAPGDADSSLAVMPEPVAPQPRVEKPARASFLDGSWTRKLNGLWAKAGKLASALLERRGPQTTAPISAAYAQHPALKALERQTARVAALGIDETKLMARTEGALQQDMGYLRETLRRTGINPDQFQRRNATAQGGPEISLDQAQVEGITDPAFASAYLRASAVLDQLNGLSDEMRHVPFITPVAGAQFDRTSGFGARVDPFTQRYAFHPGIDFAGPWGAAVMATAPGTVVFAGNRGGYGNMVEIDHGSGLHTRYGHLSRITVSLGAKLNKGATLGRLGSTGRSTGPHVHYEVWYDQIVRNPSKFIEAGRHVL